MAGVNSEEELLQMRTCLECVVLSPSLYMLIQLFSSISVNSGFWNTRFFLIRTIDFVRTRLKFAQKLRTS